MDSTSVITAIFVIIISVVSVCGTSVVVSKDGNGDYRTVSEAIEKAPEMSEEAYTIHVRQGTYQEYVVVPSKKTNIRLIGDGPTKSILLSNHTGSTIDIHGEGFMAQNMGFVNTAGLNASLAVAVRNEANKTIFFQCSVQGFQDTLWAVSGRQFYKNCDIYGTVDFIYGDAAAVFQDCNVYARFREHVTYTAQSREDPNEKTAFTFQRCKFTMSPEDSDRKKEVRATLGRPWRAYSRVVIMQSYIDSIVGREGWEPMPNQPTDKVTYLEYKNVGPGSNTDGRVDWAGVRAVHDPSQVAPFTASNLLDADSWIPSTGVPYDNGL